MRIVCPSCAARYEIADAMLAKPRTVRCSRCAREWVQDPIPPAEEAPATQDPPAPPEPAEPIVEAAQPPPPAPVAIEPLAPPAQIHPSPNVPKRTDAKVTLAWIVSLLTLAALGFAAYTYRVEIQAAWPPSERLFRLLENRPVPG